MREESRRQTHASTRRITKPKQAGGLSYVLVPDPGDADRKDPNTRWRRVTEEEEMEEILLAEGERHFEQANGTPFTVEPLRSLCGYDGLTSFADEILEGTADLEGLAVNHYTKLLLKHMRANGNPELPCNFEFEDMLNGYKKWKEGTTTSQLHLGLYKALIKHKQPTKKELDAIYDGFKEPDGASADDESNASASDDESEARSNMKSGMDVMFIHFMVLSLAVKHTHVLERWKKIITLLLEKEPGNPKLHRLRTIHLYPADYNLLLKWFHAKQLMQHAEKHGSIADQQNGGRACRSAIDGALETQLCYDVVRILKDLAIDVLNDAVACFDRIIDNQSNMNLRRQGAPKKFLKLHAATSKELKHFLKHKFGISEGFYLCEHGSGQGAGDSSPRWIFISDSAIAAYHEEAKVWVLY
jgi:hypothetical protein